MTFFFKDSSRSGRCVSVSRIICHLTSQWHVDQWWLEEVGRTQFLEGLQRSGKGRKTIHNWAKQFLKLYLNFELRPSKFLSYIPPTFNRTPLRQIYDHLHFFQPITLISLINVMSRLQILENSTLHKTKIPTARLLISLQIFHYSYRA